MAGMTTGMWIGTVVGAVVGGFATGGSPYGIIYGANIGMTIGVLVDPMDPDSDLGAPETEFGVNTTNLGEYVNDVLGTSRIGGNIMWYGDRANTVRSESYFYRLSWWIGICKGPVDILHAIYMDNKAIWEGWETLEDNPSGKITIDLAEVGAEPTLTYDSYNFTLQHAVSLTGEVEAIVGEWKFGADFSEVKFAGNRLEYYDTNPKSISNVTVSKGATTLTMLTYSIEEVTQGSKIQSITTIDLDGTFDITSESITITIYYSDSGYTIQENEGTEIEADLGTITFYFGTATQEDTVSTGTERPNQNMRGLCWCAMEDVGIGESTSAPTMSFTVSKFPSFDWNPNKIINTLDYNAAHALFYLMTESGSLPIANVDYTDDFSDAADTLLSEGLGISISMKGSNDLFDYIEQILRHIMAVMTYKADAEGSVKYHLKLLRGDENTSLLSTIDETMLLEPPEISRKSWTETINEVKAGYYEYRGQATGIRWVATGKGLAGTKVPNSVWEATAFDANAPDAFISYDMRFVCNKYIAVGGYNATSGNGNVEFSYNGIDWGRRFVSQASGAFTVIRGNQSKAMLGGIGTLLYTTDGFIYTDVWNPSIITIDTVEAIALLPGKGGGGNDRWVIAGSSHSWMGIFYSDDNGETWTQPTTYSTRSYSNEPTTMFFDGSILVVLYKKAIVQYSENYGLTWTLVAMPNPDSPSAAPWILCSYYGNGIWVAGGSRSSNPPDEEYPRLYYSYDGINWIYNEAAVGVVTETPFDIYYDGETWMMGCSYYATGNPTIYSSLDGINWTKEDQDMFSATAPQLNGVCKRSS